MEDEILNPLLDTNVVKEIKSLEEDNQKYQILLQKFENEINIREISQVDNLPELITKLQEIKSLLETILNKIKLISNYIKDDHSQKNILEKLKQISLDTSQKYQILNKKFNEKLEAAKNKIKIELNEMTNISVENANNPRLKVIQKLDNKTRMDIDRLKERQDELEKITKISHQLLIISQDMKLSSERQGRVIDSIENNLIVTDSNTNKGLEELNKRKTTQSFNIKFYFWICTTLFIVLALVILFLYLKYWKSGTN